jgi:AraC-like DNA-binding protein
MRHHPPSGEAARLERHLARHYGPGDSAVLRTGPSAKSDLSLHRKRSIAPLFGPITMPAADSASLSGFLVTIALTGYQERLVEKGQLSDPLFHAADSLRVQDLGRDYAGYLCSPFDFLLLHVTQRALDGVAEETGARRVDCLRCPSGTADPVAAHLARAMLPLLAQPDAAPTLFVDQVALAFNTHMAQRYGGLHIPAARGGGRLSRRQEERAKEILQIRMGGEISIAEVAKECGLSRSYFIKAFKETTGKTPHQWHLDHRVERVKELLAQNDTPLAEIAVICGFADQSHLTRVFGSATGMPPGAWRREYRV